jgi:hypothetical protein
VACETPGHEYPTDLELFTFQDLLDYIADEELPIDTSLYDDAAQLRVAVYDCEDDAQAYLRQQNMLQKRKKAQPDIARIEQFDAQQHAMEQKFNEAKAGKPLTKEPDLGI